MNRNEHLLYKSYQVIAYADDVAIVARGTKGVQETTTRLIVSAQGWGCKLTRRRVNL